MTRLRLSLSMILWLGLFVAKAQLKSTEKPKQPQQSLLWKIEGQGLEQPSFLFGTIHMICEDHYFWTPAMDKALKATRQLCLELPMGDTAIANTTMQAMTLPDGKQLQDYFSSDDYQYLSAVLKDSLGLPIEAFAQFKPFMLYSILTLKSADCPTPIAYEKKLMDMETQRSVPVIGLETIEQQLGIFSSLPKGDLGKMIVQLAKNLTSAKSLYVKMVGYYEQQNLDKLYKLMISSPDFGKYKNLLLDNRNRQWIPKISKIMKGTPTFFAVGAGHLPGENGVIHLLRKAGYTVTPVR